MEHRGETTDLGDGAGLEEQSDEQEQVLYSDKILVEARNPRNRGRMADADACGIVHGCCGDTMEIYLWLDGEIIQQATFMTDGRESAVACGSILTTMVRGMLLEEAGKIRGDDLIAALGGVPEAKVHCANLTVNTLRKALANQRAARGARDQIDRELEC
jgi:nitrogen fixation NifU-like protein